MAVSKLIRGIGTDHAATVPETVSSIVAKDRWMAVTVVVLAL